VWGPPQQSVDIRRADVSLGSGDGDPRVNRVARQRTSDDPPIRRTGRAGGNGYTRGRSNPRAATHRPGNVRGRRGGGTVGASGQMGEGGPGRSGTAITPGRPATIRKGLYDYTPDEVESALDIAQKALGGVLGQLRDR
jgi:hypothetical protein